MTRLDLSTLALTMLAAAGCGTGRQERGGDAREAHDRGAVRAGASALARTKDAAATGALEAFLARYPRSPRAGEASAMLGWLVIDRDLDRAEALFRAAVQDRVPAVRVSGDKGLAAVAHRRAH